MSTESSTAPLGWRQRKVREDEARRPLASALPLADEHVRKIDNSHERCQAIGLSRIERPDFSPLGRSDLTVVRDRNQRLYAHAAPVMEMLFEQVVNSGSLVLLCDATGTVLHSIGDDDFLSRASKVALAPGANWSESAKGTNAVGTALIEEQPTLVHADEHYMHANHFLTCSAAPILDPRGNILGVLDVSGDHRGYHQHTMGLVRMSARMIENHWLSDDFRDVMRLHFHTRVEFIGTLMEGILAISQDGKIVGANRGALEQLGLSGAALRMHSLASLLGTTVSALVERFRSPLAQPMPVEQPGGRQFHVYARFNWPVWHSLMSVPGSADAEQGARFSQGFAATHAGGGRVGAATGDSVGQGSMNNRFGEGLVGSSSADNVGDARSDSRGRGLQSLLTGDSQYAATIEKIRRVLDRAIPILILGETGTGKELLARAIHQDSVRSRQPFVAVNCASIPETLIESELFGYEEGAFTGARRKGSVGKIVQADGGTLFLDEIGDMPLALQAHLLRVLQESEVTPLGSRKSIAVDVTIICATHRNLREMIAAKTFREDLYYRLNGLAVRVPSLRERTDLMALVQVILQREAPHSHYRLAPAVHELFSAYGWPGNVRQLSNVLRTACVMAGHTPLLTVDHLSDDFLEDAGWQAGEAAISSTSGASPAAGPTAVSTPASIGATTSASLPETLVGRSLEDIERLSIQEGVDACGGNISEAAKRLGISRNTIYRKLRWNAKD